MHQEECDKPDQGEEGGQRNVANLLEEKGSESERYFDEDSTYLLGNDFGGEDVGERDDSH